jgi:hypothetical protein
MLFSSQVAAQTFARSFPEKAQRAQMQVGIAPEIKLNGRPDRLSPGARIRGTNNMLIPPSSMVGQEVTVNYVRDAGGYVHELWILTEHELVSDKARARKGNYTFASDADTATDDGKTPYNKLPAYKQP